MTRQLLILFFSLLPALLSAQSDYSKYFENTSLRIDYLLGGTDSTTVGYIEQMKKEPNYGGSKVNLIDENDMGAYRYQIFDLRSKQLLFSKGFCPLFQEWQTTGEADDVKKNFYQCAIVPFPKNEILFTIESKNWNGEYELLISSEINPQDYFILDEPLSEYEVEQLIESGSPEEKVDLVFLPEGYTEQQMDKFIDDVERMVEALFAVQPFKNRKADFNIYIVKVPSQQSGTDVPGDGIYRNTAFNSTFYTFDTPRYLTTKDMKSVHDAAAQVPYDHIFLLVNSSKYGGGGMYNFLTVTTVDNEMSEEVFVHEFGHAFAGLADEYYSSSVAYEEFYNLAIEPWEPNITTLVNFETKWKHLVGINTPIPTPRKADYKNSVGVFEGGGYLSEGIYSPMMDCRMKSVLADDFCMACEEAIEKAIEWHCK